MKMYNTETVSIRGKAGKERIWRKCIKVWREMLYFSKIEKNQINGKKGVDKRVIM